MQCVARVTCLVYYIVNMTLMNDGLFAQMITVEVTGSYHCLDSSAVVWPLNLSVSSMTLPLDTFRSRSVEFIRCHVPRYFQPLSIT